MNKALKKLQELRESRQAQQTPDQAKPADKTGVISPRRKLKEDLEVTDDVYVVVDQETGEIVSDLITDEEEAATEAQSIADEMGVEVVVESMRIKKSTRK